MAIVVIMVNLALHQVSPVPPTNIFVPSLDYVVDDTIGVQVSHAMLLLPVQQQKVSRKCERWAAEQAHAAQRFG